MDLLVKNRSEDCEASHTENAKQENLALVRKMCGADHGKRNENQAEIGTDIEDHLDNRVVVVCSALEILDRHRPILVKWPAEDTIIDDLDDEEADPDVPEESPHCYFEARKVTAAESQRF
jgi:hypothetical protein